MCLPSSCCLGLLNLRRGSLVIGKVLLTLYSLSAIGCIIIWILVREFHVILGPGLAVVLLHLLFSVLLIVGVRRERPCLLLTWLIYQGFMMVLGVVGASVLFELFVRISESHVSVYIWLAPLLGVLGGTAIMAYFFVVVLAFYKELRHPPSPTVVVRQPDMKMVDIA